MIRVDQPLTARDYRRLADLHRATLPTSVLGRLGPALLARYYRWAAASPYETLFVIRDGAEIDAAAVVSVAPGSVLRRFALSEMAAIVTAVLARVVIDRVFRRELAAYLGEMTQGSGGASPGPELTQIFVAPDRQALARGTMLLGLVDADLGCRGIQDYYARTIVDENEGTLAFYDRRGFTRCGEELFCGQRYARLRKSVTGPIDRA